MHELDRVFDGDDVVGTVPVDIVNHGGKRRGFTGTGRSGDEDEPFAQSAEIRDDGRQVELFKCQNVCRDESGYDADAVEVAENIYTEAVSGGQRVCKVSIVACFELVDISLRHDFKCKRLDLVA